MSKIVFDEAIARYPDRLRSAMHKATGPVGSLGNLLFDAKIKLPEIDVPRETKKAQANVTKALPTCTLISDCKELRTISIEEVVKRGIDRIPPANGEGEELRDVMHWLMILAHAQNSSREKPNLVNKCKDVSLK